jgi:CheY-like chemotaxis protein
VRIVRLRCLSCGTRSEVTLGDLETRELRTQRSINRQCRTCRGVTRHDVLSADGAQVQTSTGFRGEPGEPDENVPKPRALVIEDDPDARAILGKALAAAHFEVVSVGDGREALKILVREDFTVILSDICMPELDGKQLFDFLEKNLPDARGRVIFVTGDTANPATLEFLEATGQPYLSKPVELPLLFVLLEGLVAGSA